MLQSRILCSLAIATLILLAGCKQQASNPGEIVSPKPAAAESSPAAPSPAAPAVASAPEESSARPSGPIEFTDVTAKAGIHFKHNTGAFGKKYLPETVGSGCAFLDYDNDGWQDILLVNSMDWPENKKHRSFPALYHNNKDGTLTDVTAQ